MRVSLALSLALALSGCEVVALPDGTLTDATSDVSRVDAMLCGDTAVTPLPVQGCPALGCDQSQGGASFTLGTGHDGAFDGFRALGDGDTMYLVPGEQGLQHVLVAFRGTGLDPSLVTIEVRALRASDCVQVGYVRARFPFSPAPEDASLLALPGLRVTFTNDQDRLQYCTTLGTDILLVAVLDDGLGHAVRRERRVFLADIDPAARPDLRTAWLQACTHRDGGLPDGFPALPDASPGGDR